MKSQIANLLSTWAIWLLSWAETLDRRYAYAAVCAVKEEMDGRESKKLAKIKAIITDHARNKIGERQTRDLIYSYLCAWEQEDDQ